MKKSIIKSSGYIILSLLLVFTGFSCKNSGAGQIIGNTTAEAGMNAPVGLQIGNRAPDLAFQSPDGKIIALSELKGKMVLIDFWASWCMPCRVENPNLVSVYNAYKDKKFTGGNGFTIYSVSLDKTKEAWTEAIAKDGLTWNSHVSDLKGWDAEPASIYHIESIPANFLINGNGIIIAMNLRADALGDTMKSFLQ
jgi:thiol-disulfide isomerase/thioredoxin